MVPVLSSTTVSSCCAVSSASAERMRIPCRAPLPVPTMIDRGVARPSAHGQVVIIPPSRTWPDRCVEILDHDRALVFVSEDGTWVWAFGLYPLYGSATRLVSRNRFATPLASVFTRLFNLLVMEPGSLIMERKMLLGIKQRAEALAWETTGEQLTT
jgi:hypothetical protein